MTKTAHYLLMFSFIFVTFTAAPALTEPRSTTKKGDIFDAGPVPSDHGTVWTGTVLDVCANSLRETQVTLTISPEGGGTGTWTSTPVNVFSPAEQLCEDNGDFSKQGTWSGSYKKVGIIGMAYNLQNPDGVLLPAGRTTYFKVAKGALTIINTSSTPQTVTVLKRVHN